jgi:hypothetical protein
MNTGLISFAEAAVYLGCRPRTLYKLLARSRLRLKGVPVDGPTIEFFQARPHSPVQFCQAWLDRYITLGAHHPEDAPLLTKVLPLKPEVAAPRPAMDFTAAAVANGFDPALFAFLES